MIVSVILNLILGTAAGYLTGRFFDVPGTLLLHIHLGFCGGVIGCAALGLIGLGWAGYVISAVFSILSAFLLVRFSGSLS